MTIKDTLVQRGNRYGAFADNAKVTQDLKAVLQKHPNWQKLSADKREALEMICHKMSRIINGDPEYVDSWHDIAGYAQLVEQELLATLGTTPLEAELRAVVRVEEPLTFGGDGVGKSPRSEF